MATHAGARSASGPPDTKARQARRAQIAAVAARLFAEAGVGAVSMDDISREVGLAKATLYHYFKTRDDIVFAIHERGMNELASRAAERAADGVGPMERLRGVFHDGLQSVHDNPGYSRVVFEQLRQLPPRLRSKVLTNQRNYQAAVKSILDEGVADGTFKKADTHVLTLALFGLINWSHQWYSPGGEYTPTELADQFFCVFVRGVAAEGAALSDPKSRAKSVTSEGKTGP